MFIKSILVGLALESGWVSLDTLHEPGWHTVYYESVMFEVWGTLEVNVTGKGHHYVRWDTRDPKSWRNYLKAREKLARTPMPYGTT